MLILLIILIAFGGLIIFIGFTEQHSAIIAGSRSIMYGIITMIFALMIIVMQNPTITITHWDKTKTTSEITTKTSTGFITITKTSVTCRVDVEADYAFSFMLDAAESAIFDMVCDDIDDSHRDIQAMVEKVR